MKTRTPEQKRICMVQTGVERKESDRALSSEEIKSVALEILKTLDVFPQKHNLRYWIFYGTLIEPARHQGFTPWDDGIDVVMPKDDYYRLIDLINKSHAIGEHYRLSSVSVKNTVAAQSFGKIFDTQTRAIANDLVPIKGLDEGLWVDIFSLVGIDKDPSMGKASYVKAFDACCALLWRAALKFTQGTSPGLTLRRLFALVPTRIAGVSYWASKCNRIQCKAPDMFDLSLCIQASNSNFTYPTDSFLALDGKLSYLNFEGHPFPVPAQWDSLLQLRYGNWRKFPLNLNA